MLSQARIFAVDVSENCLQVASEVGADEAVPLDADAAEKIMSSTDGRGCDAIIDFVAVDQSLLFPTKVSRPHGRIVFVGMQRGTVRLGWSPCATGEYEAGFEGSM